MQAYAIKADDKYGDYGIVGFVTIEIGETKVELCEFVMSCRVASKFCEQSVIAYFAHYFSDKGYTELNAKVVRTDRNMALINAFSVIPFKAYSIDDKNVLYSLPLAAGDPVPGLFVNPVVCESLKK